MPNSYQAQIFGRELMRKSSTNRPDRILTYLAFGMGRGRLPHKQHFASWQACSVIPLEKGTEGGVFMDFRQLCPRAWVLFGSQNLVGANRYSNDS